MTASHVAFALTSIALLAGSAGQAAAQSREGQCFEVLAAQPNIAPGGPLLVDKCSGQTWLLTKSHQRSRAGGITYRWSPVPVDHPAVAKAPAPVAPAAATRERCFTFQGRQFCE